MRKLQKLIGTCTLMNLTVLILMNVGTEKPAPKNLSVRIQMEASSANVVQVSKVIFAETLMSVTKQMFVTQMQHV